MCHLRIADFMLVYASGHAMTVTLGPLQDAIKRIAYLYDLPTYPQTLKTRRGNS